MIRKPIILAAAGLIGVGALAACQPLTSRPLSTTTPSSTSGWRATPTYAYSTPTTTAEQGILPTPDMFKIPVTVIQQHCYGEAGCNVTYEIDPTYIGSAPLTKSAFRVLYTVEGGDEGLQTESFTVAGGEHIRYKKQGFISTGDDRVSITATPTRVIPES
jgi:hypothetical protein